MKLSNVLGSLGCFLLGLPAIIYHSNVAIYFLIMFAGVGIGYAIDVLTER